MKILNIVMGIILLIIGGFYTFMPHTFHVSSGIGFGLAHNFHVIIGILSLIFGIIILLIGIKK